MVKILDVQNVKKVIGGKTIIEDISLSIEQGDILGFLGPNGAGKTTLIKMITGLYNINSGHILVNNIDLSHHHDQALQYIGAVIENPEMYPYLSGYDNLVICANMHSGITKERIQHVVRLVKLENRIHDKVKKYSLGMKQRLGIAQALLHRPKLLILDEPTNGLDPMGIIELREMIKNLAHKEKTGVLISSHILGEMELVCNKFCIIDNGKIIFEGHKDDFEEGELEQYYMEKTQGSKNQIR